MYSKRHMRSLVSKEVDKIIVREKTPIINESLPNSAPESFVVPEEDYKCASEENICTKLRSWGLKHLVSRNCFDDLLEILQSENINVPLSSKTIIKTNQCVIKTVAPGSYLHFGLKNQLLKMSDAIKDLNIIYIDINIDGLPLYKSSNIALWPILGKIVNHAKTKVFPIGVYLGKKKLKMYQQFVAQPLHEVNVTDLSQSTDMPPNQQYFAAPLVRCNATIQDNESIENKINALDHQIIGMNHKIDVLQRTIEQQIKQQAQYNILVKKSLEQSKHEKSFPIKTEEQLRAIENDLKENQDIYKPSLIKIIQLNNFAKIFPKIICEKLLMEYNLDGLKGKKNFKELQALNNAIFDCVQKDGYTISEYYSDVRQAFRQTKNRVNKKNSLSNRN